MNNFLKSECYKVSHRAYPYTLLIIGVVIAILINVSVWYAIHVIRIPFTIEGADIMNAGLYMMATIVWYCIIFTTDIGFSGEWRNNTMKNIVSFRNQPKHNFWQMYREYTIAAYRNRCGICSLSADELHLFPS